MLKKVSAMVVLALFLGAASADAADNKKKRGNNGGGPAAWAVSCMFDNGKVDVRKFKNPSDGIQRCLTNGGHPIGVAPIFGRKPRK